MGQAMTAQPALRTPWPDDEEKLFLAILGRYREGGFAAVHRSCSRQQKRLAEKFREEIDREGWII